MKERIGVYICHCGGNISDYVDVEEIAKLMQQEDGVVVSKNVMFACADSNQKEMISDIREKKLDAIVVASCSPKLHLHTFRNVADRAGLNPFNYVQVNIREQCSWAHSDLPEDATHKAVGLIRGGIKRVGQSEALENIEIEAKKSAVIVGAGVSGMRAAIGMAKLGNNVFLIEKDFFVGGKVAHSDGLFLSDLKGKQLVRRLFEEIKSIKNIALFTGAEVEKVAGNVGNFSVEVKINPRYIKENASKERLTDLMKDCHIQVDDHFHFGLLQKNAVSKKYPDAMPDIPVADKNALEKESALLSGYPDCIDIGQKPETITLQAGSVLVTTGFDYYQPKENEFGYNSIPHVVTLPELKSIMANNNSKLIYRNKEIKTLAFIYCIGNRQSKGENKYCSRVCCSAGIHSSIMLKDKYKDMTAFHLFRDIRTYGKQELLYEKSSKQGDIYVKYDEKDPPSVEIINNQLIVKVKDHLTSKQEIEIPADLVVLVTGMVAASDSASVAEKFKIPVGSDKFFNEIHPKLKPVETVIKGVFIGGACQGPKNISESLQSSLSAVSKMNALVKDGKLFLDPVIARVDAEKCTWCGKCAEVCEYGAISETGKVNKQTAFVNQATCVGCGICAPVCPEDAIEIVQYTNSEIESMIDGYMAAVIMQEKSAEKPVEEEKHSSAMKEFPQIWEKIAEAIGNEPKTIPQIAYEINEDTAIVTYHLMTMNKYGIVAASGMNEKETHYLYNILQ